MPINRKLLEILVCPITKLSVAILDGENLAKLNVLIAQGELQTMSGKAICKPLEAALITRNKNIVYRIENDIPIMLEAESIAADQIAEVFMGLP